MAEAIIPPSWNSMVVDSNIILPSYSYVKNDSTFYTDLYVIDADSMSVLTYYSSSVIYNKYLYPAFETILSSTSLIGFSFIPMFHTDSNIYFTGLIITEQSEYSSYIVTDLQLNFISSNSSTSIAGCIGMALSNTSFLLCSFSTSYITDSSFNIQYSYHIQYSSQPSTDYEINSFCFDGTYIYLYLFNYYNYTSKIVVFNTELEMITETSPQSIGRYIASPSPTIFSTGETIVLKLSYFDISLNKRETYTTKAPIIVANITYFDSSNNLVSPFYLYALSTLRNGEKRLIIVYESPIGDYTGLFSTTNKKYINDWSRNISYYSFVGVPAA